MAAWSRWRRTTVVVRQFSLVAISLIHPPAGIRCGVSRTAFTMPSSTGRTGKPVFGSGVWSLCSVLMDCFSRPSRSACPGGTGHRGGPFSPHYRFLSPEGGPRRGKRSGVAFQGTWPANPGTSVWLSRVLPRDPHSDQQVNAGCSYNRKMCRVGSSHPAVQRLNVLNGKDINAGSPGVPASFPDLPACRHTDGPMFPGTAGAFSPPTGRVDPEGSLSGGRSWYFPGAASRLRDFTARTSGTGKKK